MILAIFFLIIIYLLEIFGGIKIAKCPHFDIIIIGAGISGLSAGIHLKNKNRKIRTLIVDQGNKPGGSLIHPFNDNQYFGFLTQGIPFKNKKYSLSTSLEKLAIEFPLVKVDPIEVIKLQDKEISLYTNLEIAQKELVAHFPEEEKNIELFFYTCYQMMEEARKTQISALWSLKTCIKCSTIRKYAFLNFSQFIEQFISTEELRKILSIYPSWLGILPEQLKAFEGAMLVAQAHKHGYFYPKSGIQQFLEEFQDNYLSKNGKLKLNTKVHKIAVDKKTVQGVELADGRLITGKIIISTIGLKTTILKLINEKALRSRYPRKVKQLKSSSSGVLVFLQVAMDLSKYPAHLSIGTQEPAIRKALKNEFSPTEVLIRIPSNILSSNEAPKNSTVLLFTHVPYNLFQNELKKLTSNNKEQKLSHLKERLVPQLISLAEQIIPSLSEKIVGKKLLIPENFAENNGSIAGSIYGLISGQQLPDFKAPIKHLYYTKAKMDQSSLLDAMNAGMEVAEYIIQEYVHKRGKSFC
ncbi:MAG: FAD-dependent oxidoreductase [Candidatus Heimdallarchaeota archaeon]|nr:FAD-dependent oxidoreductase [Candidatus Heimdallarchaeota archaeon]